MPITPARNQPRRASRPPSNNDSGLTTPPHNIESEEALIGALLIDPSIINDVSSILPEGSEEFYITRHGWIYAAIDILTAANVAVDILTVQEQLDKSGQLAEVGGPAYITRLITLTPSAYNAEAYARLVHEAYVRRGLIQAASNIAKLAYDVGTDIDTVVIESQKTLDSSSPKLGFDHHTKTFRQAADHFYAQVEYNRANPDAAKRLVIPTGFADLDPILDGGIWNDEMITVAAPTGRGKSALASSLAVFISKQAGRRPHIWTGEMKDDSYIQRMMAAYGDPDRLQISNRKIRLGQMSDEEWDYFTEVKNVIRELEGTINDCRSVNIDVFLRSVRRMAKLGLVDLVIADYLQLMQGTYGKNYDSQEMRFSDVADGLATIPQDSEIAIPVMATAQFNRKRGDKARPTLSDLKYSSKIEQNSTGVWLMWDPDGLEPKAIQAKLDTKKERGEAPIYPMEILVEKQRNGRTGACTLGFWMERVAFVNVTTQVIDLNGEPAPLSFAEDANDEDNWTDV